MTPPLNRRVPGASRGGAASRFPDPTADGHDVEPVPALDEADVERLIDAIRIAE